MKVMKTKAMTIMERKKKIGRKKNPGKRKKSSLRKNPGKMIGVMPVLQVGF